MTTDTSEVLIRFHRTLVEEIVTHRPDYLDKPFTVAEIYQNLVPYGSHRDRIGVEMNGDYEDALLRLLVGEGEYLILESDAALRALREELESSNPNTGVFRDYAAVDVRLNPAGMGGMERAPELPLDRASGEVEPMEDLVPVGDLAPEAPDPSLDDAVARKVDTCRWCRAELPGRANLNFCPFCGTDVNVVPCPGCSEELEPDWRFCIACGTEVPT